MPLTRQRSRVDGHFWFRTILISAVVFSGKALLLQFIGFVTPGWIVLSQPSGFMISAGVWYIQICIHLSKCRTASMTRIENPFNVAGDNDVQFTNWVELQVEVTLAFVSCIACVLMSINALMNMSSYPRSFLGWQIVTAFVSAGLLMIPIGRLLDIIREWDSHVIYATPYSLISSCIGCLCIILSAILSMIALCMIMYDIKKEKRNTEERDNLTLNTT
ncbi:hypothetical protein ACF0H5_000896 [Mactra antiquata]